MLVNAELGCAFACGLCRRSAHCVPGYVSIQRSKAYMIIISEINVNWVELWLMEQRTSREFASTAVFATGVFLCGCIGAIGSIGEQRLWRSDA